MKALFIIIGLGVAAGVVGAAWWSSQASTGEGNPSGANDDVVMPVRVEPLQPGTERAGQLELVGTVTPNRRIPLAFQVGGRLAQVNAQLGDHVWSGTVLAALDKRDFRIAVREAAAMVRTAEANVEIAQQSGVAVADRAMVRTQKLAQVGGATEAILDQVTAQQNAAKTQLLGAQAQLERALALRDRARAAMSDTVLKAPFNALIIQRFVEVGLVVGPGTGAFVLEDVDQMRITASIPAADLAQIDREQQVEVRVEAADGFEALGKIRALGWAGDAATGTFPIELIVPNPDHRLRSGMTAWLKLAKKATAVRTTTFAVPLTAVVSRGEGKSVFVINPGESSPRARQVPIQLHGFAGDRTLVSGDLERAMMLVVSGQRNLRDNMRVQTGDTDR